MEKFAVLDTETNWENEMMSIGTVVAEVESFHVVDLKYQIITPEYLVGGMYDRVLEPRMAVETVCCSRRRAMEELLLWLRGHDISAIFAYNAGFDYGLLPELHEFDWYDIMRLAAYRQHNPRIPGHAPCFSTGRIKSGYGVEPMLRLLRDSCTYRESHNAFFDAMDELEIMALLGHCLADYIPL